MSHFFQFLQCRNEPLFLFGCCNMLAAAIFFLLTRYSNRWFKPFKFALSIAIFSWTMGWYSYELNDPVTVSIYSWATIILLGFDVAYISLQAGRGQLSHYNTSTPIYSFMTIMIALAAAIVTLWTGYIGLLFLTEDLSNLPYYYVLSIRIGILLFVIFSFQGASMGARQQHTIGGPDGGPGLPVVKWSTKYGDLRIAHFIGMHALQILPLLSWYVLKNTVATGILGLLYAMLAILMLTRALQGKPLARAAV